MTAQLTTDKRAFAHEATGLRAIAKESGCSHSRIDVMPRGQARAAKPDAWTPLNLFESQGFWVTTVAAIVTDAGTSVCTFWRNFSSKEDAVRPLLEEGLRDAVARWGNVARGKSLADAWVDPSPAHLSDIKDVVRLLSLAASEPAINAFWLRVHHDAIHVLAAVLNAALAEANEHYATEATPDLSIGDVVAKTVRYAGNWP